MTKFLADGIASYTERADVSGVMGRVEQLLDESVAAHEYLIPDSDAEALFDLGAVDWKGLEEAFKQGRARTAAQRLRSLVSARVTALIRLNPVRVDPVERFETLVADYNAGSMNTETFFQELLKFSDTLTEEEARALAEGLNEEQLAIFDLLMRPAPELSEDEKSQVKRVAEDLLAILKPTRSSSTGGSSRARGRRCALPWRRSWTGCRRSSRASSTPRKVMGCTSTFR